MQLKFDMEMKVQQNVARGLADFIGTSAIMSSSQRHDPFA